MTKRTLTEWAAIAEIIASVAVVLSLLFVGYQLHRNTTELRAAHSNDMFDSIREIELTVLTSPQLQTIYNKVWYGRRNEMSADEIDLHRIYLMQTFTVWEQAHARMLDGSISESDYYNWRNFFVQYIRYGTTMEDIETMLPWFADDRFADEVRELSENTPREVEFPN